MKKLALYHDHCMDGSTCGWIYSRYNPGALVHPLQHNAKTLPVSGDFSEIILMDIVPDSVEFFNSINPKTKITILDHHLSAHSRLNNIKRVIDVVVIDIAHCATRIVWNHYFPSRSEPWFLRYVEDRDLWKWEEENSKEISAFFESMVWRKDNSIHKENYNWLETQDSSILADKGKTILAYQAALVNEAIERKQELSLDGHQVFAVNSTILRSEIGHKLCDFGEFGVVWAFDDTGKKINWSLRSNGFDVRQIAESFGGGGHTQAAGFQTDRGYTFGL